jgi:thioredoxin-like negative regulator of GroEL
MADTTLPDSYVQKFLNNFEIGKINAEVDTMTAARFGVRSFPTVLMLKPNGIEIDRDRKSVV